MPSRPVLAGVAAVAIAVGALAQAQTAGAPNGQPNPYRTEEGFVTLPAGMRWPDGAAPGTPFAGQVVGIDFDEAGNIYFLRRADPPLLKFDPSGRRLLRTFGQGLLVMGHGLLVDSEGSIWVTDSAGRDGKGYQVFKLGPDGEVLMALGTRGVSGEEPGELVAPTDVAIAPGGDIFVSDGHGGNDRNHRVVKFSKDGRFVKAWGRRGSGPGELNAPHDIAIDSRGRIFVADRGNSRLQIFDQEGRLLDEWRQFGRPEVIAIDKDDTLYVTDSQSNAKVNAPFRKGIRVGSAVTGVVHYFIPDTSDPESDGGAVAIGVDAGGAIYTAEVFGVVGFERMLKKYTRQ